MNKHGYKIGDKVKLKHPKRWSMCTQIGVVVGFDEYYIRVSYKGNVCYEDYPHLPREIYKVSRKGEQLEFAFMQTSN